MIMWLLSLYYGGFFNIVVYYNIKFIFKKVKLFRVMIKIVYLCLWKRNRNSISLCDNYCDVKI